MKKRNFLFTVIFLLSLTRVSAQGSDYNSDTIILDYHNFDSLYLYHNPDLAHDDTFNVNGCFMNYQVPPPPKYNDPTNVRYVDYYQDYMHPSVQDPVTGEWGIPYTFNFSMGDPILSENNYHPEGFGQPFHLEDSVYIIGVAARIEGYGFSQDFSKKFRLFNEDMSIELAESVNCLNGIGQQQVCDTTPLKAWFFVSDVGKVDDKFKVKDFVIAVDVPRYDFINHQHTCSIFDTVWQDTLIGCQAQYSPYIKKGGEWKTFAEDTIYFFWQKMCIEWFPIIYSPRIESSGLEELTQESFSIFPNPAKEEITIESPYEIERIE
ncbi:MAG: hypothetical protein MJZ71_08050, partial [Bacteroidales bacterium]|nr:hypothetical protein [Bacteroidales bacterium]